MGVARDNLEAALIIAGPQGDRPPPQLYSAPDPTVRTLPLCYDNIKNLCYCYCYNCWL